VSSVVVVDSGVANVGSVVAALERAQASVTISRDWEVIRRAARVLLPGVGAAVAAMRELDRLGLSERLPTLTQPVLGVCLGMQLMFEGSEEGGVPVIGNRESGIGSAQPGSVGSIDSPFPIPHSPTLQPCLGILPGYVRRLPESPGVRIPHMGWNALIPRRPHALVAGLGERDYAYFVHSFGAAESELTLMACEHGSTFSAVVARANFMGAQFHPERSAAVGARLLDNFLKLDLETLAQC
jgi:glutamine amidotransferase